MMKLRDHPLLSHRGVRSWPPVWHCLGDGRDRHPRGEIGILKDVKVPVTTPMDRCFLVMEHMGTLYMACLFFANAAAAISLSKFLGRHCGEPIEKIAELDISHMH